MDCSADMGYLNDRYMDYFFSPVYVQYQVKTVRDPRRTIECKLKFSMEQEILIELINQYLKRILLCAI